MIATLLLYLIIGWLIAYVITIDISGNPRTNILICVIGWLPILLWLAVGKLIKKGSMDE